jgi:hypothetical protein
MLRYATGILGSANGRDVYKAFALHLKSWMMV